MAGRASILLFGLGLATTGSTQDDTAETALAPRASHGGRAEILSTQRLDESDDPLNRFVESDLVSGLIITVTVEDHAIRIDRVTPARLSRRRVAAQNRSNGDWVRAVATVAGEIVAEAYIPDPRINAHEEDGIIVAQRRQVVLMLASEQAIDTVVVEANATNVRTSRDVRPAYRQALDHENGMP